MPSETGLPAVVSGLARVSLYLSNLQFVALLSLVKNNPRYVDMPSRCEQFGFDRKKIDQRLAFLCLTKRDHLLAKRLNLEVIAPNVDKIIDRFYETLLFNPESRKWLLSGETIGRLKVTQRSYLLTLGDDFSCETYFEGRLNIGVVHAALGLPLSVYLCSYSVLTRYIIEAIPDDIANNVRHFQAMVNFLNKITSLDISLAIETYYSSNINNLECAVEELHSRESKLITKAESDAMTGLLNRDTVFQRLFTVVENIHQRSGTFGILMIDIDYFKNVNDTLGHQAGDEVLKQIAKCISESLRPSDIIGRYGGEEFIVGQMDVTPNTANVIAERVRQRVAELNIHFIDSVINNTISIGIASLRKDEDLVSLIKRADMALYAAKAAGRNCVITM